MDLAKIQHQELDDKYFRSEVGTAFLDRVDIAHPMSKIAQNEIVKAGDFFIGQDPLGQTFRSFIVARRLAALEFDTPTSSLIAQSYNPNDPEYKRIKQGVLAKKQGCYQGIQVLLWVFPVQRFGTYFFGRQSTRRIGAQLMVPQTKKEMSESAKETYVGGLLHRPTIWTVNKEKGYFTKDGVKKETIYWKPDIVFDSSYDPKNTAQQPSEDLYKETVNSFLTVPEPEPEPEPDTDRPR